MQLVRQGARELRLTFAEEALELFTSGTGRSTFSSD